MLTAERLALLVFAALALLLAVVAVVVWVRTVRALRHVPAGPMLEEEAMSVRAWRGVLVMVQIIPTLGLGIWFGLMFYTGEGGWEDKIGLGIWAVVALGIGGMMLTGRARMGEYVGVDQRGLVVLQGGRFARLGWDDVVVSPTSDGAAVLDRRDGGRSRRQLEISAVLADTISRNQTRGPLETGQPTAPVEYFGV